MAEGRVGVNDQAPGPGVAEVRTRDRTVGGSAGSEQVVIPIAERVPSYLGGAATFRSVGSLATPQWLLQFANAAGSTVLVVVRQLTVSMDSTAATTTPLPILGLSRPTGTATGGTALTKTNVGTGADSAQTSNASVTGLGGASADGTNSSPAIGGLTLANRLWRAMGMRMHTAAGQSSGIPKELVPPALRHQGVILRAGDQLAVTVETNAAADNVATYHYVTSILWEEYTLP